MAKVNLLVTALDFIRRSGGSEQKEDFFTEVLATLLRLSPAFRDGFISLVFDDLDADAPEAKHWTVATQESVEVEREEEGKPERAIPDLVLYGASAEDDDPHCLIAVEVKVGQHLYSGQLEKYLRWLESESEDLGSVHLAALTPARPGRRLPIDGGGSSYWRRRVRWEEVQQLLDETLAEKDQIGHGQDQESADERAAFRTYGSDFSGLLVDEGLVAPAPINPVADAQALQDGAEKQEALDRVGRLLTLALSRAQIIETLEDEDRGWYRKIAHRGPRHVQDTGKGFVRIQFSPQGHKGTFLFFGFAYHQRGWIRRYDQDERPLDSLDLLAGLEVWISRGDEGSHLLSQQLEGNGPPDALNWKLAEQLNGKLEADPEIYVPHERDWAKFVRRRSIGSFPEDKDQQVGVMVTFYQEFLDAFLEADGQLLGYANDSLLDAITKRLG